MSSKGIYRLVYVSRNALQGTVDILEAEVASILATSRRNNEKAGITGALLFNADCFAQVLEGEPAAVQTVFERIQCDPRHRQTVILSAGPAAQSDFGDWSMAYAGRIDDSRMRFGLLTGTGQTPPDTSAAEITTMLRLAILRCPTA